MAFSNANSSTFTILASALAVTLVAAVAVLALQSGSSGEADGNAAALAAVSQAIPLHTARALQAGTDGLDDLQADVSRLDELRSGGFLTSSGAWDNLEHYAKAILEKRADIEVLTGSIQGLNIGMTKLLSASDALLDQSGSTAVIQEFQRRGNNLRSSFSALVVTTLQGGPAVAVAGLEADLAYLRSVTNALSGDSTELDVVALDNAARESALVPVISELQDVEALVGPTIAAAANLDDLVANVNGLNEAALTLLRSALSSAGSGAGGFMSSSTLPIGILVIAFFLLLGLAFLHSKSAVFEQAAREQAQQNDRNQQAILRLLDELGSLADGDLSVEATVTEDITGAIADSINYAIEKLRELVATINETAIMVDSAAKQTENMALQLATSADTQAKEITAATGSIVSMASSIEEVSGNAERSSDVARHSVEVAHKGGDAVRRTIDGMNAIRETIQETSKRIKRLGESSQEIGNIVELINDIAEQTNILALNASIQASMAGEAGRGFAVVADEVQRLAERSTNATKQIEVLVKTIQADTNEAVVSMERSTTDVVGGALLAENAGAALDEIEQVSNQIASLVKNISVSARQQAGSAADVTRRTTRLKEISDQTGKATTATAASISKLSGLASQLRQTVAGFTLPNSALEGSALSTASSNSPAAKFRAQEEAAG